MYVHDISPFLWHITEDFGVHWNGFSYTLSLIFAFILIRWMALRQRTGITSEVIMDFVIYCSVGALVGGRLGYCLFYAPDLALKFKAEFPFWGILAIDEGGMSGHGGFIGVFVAVSFFAMRTGLSRLYFYDLAALAGAFGIFLGRTAHFFSGEMIGKVSQLGLSFTVKFPSEIFQWAAKDVQRLSELGPIVAQVSAVAGDQWAAWLENFQTNENAKASVNDGLMKIVAAIQSGNESVKNSLAPLLMERHPSQLYAAVGEGLLVFIFLFLLWRKPRRSGVIAANFLILSGLARILGEQFREADPFVSSSFLGWTQGPWLSAIMLIIGIVLLFIWGRRETLPVSGWGRGHSVRLHRR